MNMKLYLKKVIRAVILTLNACNKLFDSIKLNETR